MRDRISAALGAAPFHHARFSPLKVLPNVMTMGEADLLRLMEQISERLGPPSAADRSHALGNQVDELMTALDELSPHRQRALLHQLATATQAKLQELAKPQPATCCRTIHATPSLSTSRSRHHRPVRYGEMACRTDRRQHRPHAPPSAKSSMSATLSANWCGSIEMPRLRLDDGMIIALPDDAPRPRSPRLSATIIALRSPRKALKPPRRPLHLPIRAWMHPRASRRHLTWPLIRLPTLPAPRPAATGSHRGDSERSQRPRQCPLPPPGRLSHRRRPRRPVQG